MTVTNNALGWEKLFCLGKVHANLNHEAQENLAFLFIVPLSVQLSLLTLCIIKKQQLPDNFLLASFQRNPKDEASVGEHGQLK